MRFEVAYRDDAGKMSQTTVEVANRNVVYSELRRLGITPISIQEVDEKKKHGGGEPGAVARVIKVVVFLVLLAVAAAAVWYFVLADDGAKQRVRNAIVPSAKDDARAPGGSAPRKGTGAVSVKISK